MTCLESIKQLFVKFFCVSSNSEVTKILALTQREYDDIGIGNYDQKTLYIIRG